MLENNVVQIAPNAATQNIERYGDPIYHGKSKLGKAQFICDGQKLMGVGLLEACGDANAPHLDNTVYTVPGYVANATKDKVWMCRGAMDGKPFRFTGRMIPYVPAVKSSSSAAHPMDVEQMMRAATDVNPPSLDAMPMTADACSSISPTAAPAEVRKRTMRALPANYATELERIRLARAAGLDPDVRIDFIVPYLSESRANIYRKLKLGQFPKSVKRGRGSYWPLSVVEAYRTGKTWEVSHG